MYGPKVSVIHTFSLSREAVGQHVGIANECIYLKHQGRYYGIAHILGALDREDPLLNSPKPIFLVSEKDMDPI